MKIHVFTNDVFYHVDKVLNGRVELATFIKEWKEAHHDAQLYWHEVYEAEESGEPQKA